MRAGRNDGGAGGEMAAGGGSSGSGEPSGEHPRRRGWRHRSEELAPVKRHSVKRHSVERCSVKRCSVVVALALAAAVAPPASAAPELPTLIVEAPPELGALTSRVRAFDRRRLETAMELTGLAAPGAPILLVLAPEGSDLALRAPAWASGYAHGPRGVAVVLPERIPRYPHHSLESVIQHEVAHVLVARAAGGRPVPRWFDEGVAMAAARAWTFEDRTQLALGLLTGGPRSLTGLEAAFHSSGAADVSGAYALSAALVREVQSRAGREATGEILRRVGGGAAFDQAFAEVAGEPLHPFARAFLRRQTLWFRWVPFLTSSAALWMGITLLALYAFRRRRRRDAELARRWEEEDRLLWEREKERLWRVRVHRREPPDELVN